jgi:hypothetical protein
VSPTAEIVEGVDDQGQARLDAPELLAEGEAGGLAILGSVRSVEAEGVSESGRHPSLIPP